MKYCSKCRVNVAGNRDKCPLCQSELKDIGGDKVERYPKIKKQKSRMDFACRLIITVLIGIIAVCAVINYILPQGGLWYRFVIGGAITVLVMWFIVVSKYKNVLKCILYETVTIGIIAITWDYFTGMNGWSVNFVVPCVFSTGPIVMGILTKALNIANEEHIVYLISLTIFGIVSSVLLLNDFVKIGLPSIICVCINSVLLLILVVFEGKNMWNEFKRRLHT